MASAPSHSTTRRVPAALATATAMGLVLMVLSLGEQGPAGRLAAEVPPAMHDDLLLVGFGLLGLVGLVLTLYVAAKATAFLLLLAFTGREALAELPDLGPLLKVALGVMLIAAALFGATVKMSEEREGGEIPFLSGGEGEQPADGPQGRVGVPAGVPALALVVRPPGAAPGGVRRA